MSPDNSYDTASFPENPGGLTPQAPDAAPPDTGFAPTPFYSPTAGMTGPHSAFAPSATPPVDPGYQVTYPQYDPGPPGVAYPPGPYGPIPYSAVPYGQAMEKNGTGVAALILGILAVFCFSILAGVPAIILGFSGRKAANEGRATNGGVAMAGIVLGFASVAFLVFLVIMAAASNGALPVRPRWWRRR